MALGQAFITFIDVAESSRRFFDAIVDILNEAFPDVDDKSGISLPGETGLVIKCLDGFIAVCGSSGEKLAKLQTENRGIAYLLKNNATFSEKLSFVENSLEGHEVFFNDIRNALEWVFEKMSPSGSLVSLPIHGQEMILRGSKYNSIPASARSFLTYLCGHATGKARAP